MIDARAIIDPSAKIADSANIGPWTIIEADVEIGDGTEIGSHVVIGNNTTVGKQNKIYSHTVIGTDPQHIRASGEKTALVIGDHNVIREFVTINRGTLQGGGVTTVGNHNYLMAYSHIAHDCQVADYVTFLNLASIAGHVVVDSYATLGAFVGVHQFCRIGAYSFLGRAAKVAQDILPYTLVVGNPGSPRGINCVGLRRQHFPPKVISALKKAYHLIHQRHLKMKEICAMLESQLVDFPELKLWIDMLTTSSRGVARNFDNPILEQPQKKLDDNVVILSEA